MDHRRRLLAAEDFYAKRGFNVPQAQLSGKGAAQCLG
jgi:hypothetical protein